MKSTDLLLRSLFQRFKSLPTHVIAAILTISNRTFSAIVCRAFKSESMFSRSDMGLSRKKNPVQHKFEQVGETEKKIHQ